MLLFVIVVFIRWGSLDKSEVFIDGAKKADAAGYVSFDSSSLVDNADIYLFALVNNQDKEELFYTNNSLNWSPGPSGIWHNYKNSDDDYTEVHGSGDISLQSDLRLNKTIDWDAGLLFKYGDHKYSIDIEDHSSYDHEERFVTYGYGGYGGDFESW